MLNEFDPISLLDAYDIDFVGRQALEDKDLDGFIAARERTLAGREQNLLASYGLVVGGKVKRADDDVDIDDE